MEWTPLLLERRLDSRIWGGSTLGPWLGLDDPPRNLAESWQVYAENTITNGSWAGQTLAEVVGEHGAAIVGTRSFACYGANFPLLAKFIDAADDLSVQVHPDDQYAHTVEAATGFHGKTEAWYILQAAADAEVLHGFDAPTDRTSFARSIENNTVADQIRHVRVAAGDTIFVPAGTVHAINRGILLFEIQQTSDLTYRVYDYDRRDDRGQPRELHLDRALDVIDYNYTAPANVEPQPIDDDRTLLVECPYFAMERWTVAQPLSRSTDPATFEIWTVIDGAATLTHADQAYDLARGTSIVLPAQLGAYTIGSDQGATVLRCFVP